MTTLTRLTLTRGEVMQPRVYLAGPITGLTYNGATTWREDARSYLAAKGITAYSPMRPAINDIRCTVGPSYAFEALTSSLGRNV